jgi:antitoxin component YwqK of YwqJK toxin-antitoxin module
MDRFKGAGHGQLKAETNFKDNKREGIAKSYYPSGQLQNERNFKNDKLEGIVKSYWGNGKIKHIDTYKNGIMINQKTFSKGGKLRSDQDYPTE